MEARCEVYNARTQYGTSQRLASKGANNLSWSGQILFILAKFDPHNNCAHIQYLRSSKFARRRRRRRHRREQSWRYEYPRRSFRSSFPLGYRHPVAHHDVAPLQRRHSRRLRNIAAASKRNRNSDKVARSAFESQLFGRSRSSNVNTGY